MTNAPEMQCPDCQLTFLDAPAVKQHAMSEHRETRQQTEQHAADETTPEDVRANNPQMAAAQPHEATQQGTQQQQR